VLGVPFGREKDATTLIREISLFPPDSEYPRGLWLYTKAEQVRQTIGELLEGVPIEKVEQNLTNLADAVVISALRDADPENELAVVALGKFGSGELTPGSDLDVILLCPDGDISGPVKKAERLREVLSYRHPLGRTYELDLRLRPHGADGPIVTTIRAMREYHHGTAQVWERQVLTRSRCVGGNEQLAQAFVELRQTILYENPISSDEVRAILKMREKIEIEKGLPNSPESAFKSGPGGLVDIEFIAQIKQLQSPDEDSAIRSTNTRLILAALGDRDMIKKSDADQLLGNYNFLRRLEYNLRRDTNKAVTAIGDGEVGRNSLAKWMQFDTFEELWKEHCARMRETRRIFDNLRT